MSRFSCFLGHLLYPLSHDHQIHRDIVNAEDFWEGDLEPL